MKKKGLEWEDVVPIIAEDSTEEIARQDCLWFDGFVCSQAAVLQPMRLIQFCELLISCFRVFEKRLTRESYAKNLTCLKT